MRVRAWLVGCIGCLCSSCAGVPDFPRPPYSALAHVGLIQQAQKDAVDQYIRDKAWIGLTKAQMEQVLRRHGFAEPYLYIAPYEGYWGKYDGALVVPQFWLLGTYDLWILFDDGKVANVGTMYRD